MVGCENFTSEVNISLYIHLSPDPLNTHIKISEEALSSDSYLKRHTRITIPHSSSGRLGSLSKVPFPSNNELSPGLKLTDPRLHKGNTTVGK